MNATEARELTEKSTPRQDISKLMLFVYDRIKRTAEIGKAFVIDPLRGVTDVTENDRLSVYARLREDGFLVEPCPPDNGEQYVLEMKVSW